MLKEDAFDFGLRTNIDNTTSATYTYICKSLDPRASILDRVWVCYRLENATGSKSFANGIDSFTKKDSLITVSQALTATYAG